VSSYRVALTASAEKELNRLPAKVVAALCRVSNIWLRLPGLRAARNSRIVYVIDDTARTVDVTRIAHRREVYE
jgi:mRNA-degrading endonuclease RelE of RelBE toxin-antitoxin system